MEPTTKNWFNITIWCAIIRSQRKFPDLAFIARKEGLFQWVLFMHFSFVWLFCWICRCALTFGHWCLIRCEWVSCRKKIGIHVNSADSTVALLCVCVITRIKVLANFSGWCAPWTLDKPFMWSIQLKQTANGNIQYLLNSCHISFYCEASRIIYIVNVINIHYVRSLIFFSISRHSHIPMADVRKRLMYVQQEHSLQRDRNDTIFLFSLEFNKRNIVRI